MPALMNATDKVGAMTADPLVAELHAACASLVAAVAGAEAEDWVMAERATLDAQERTARILRELALKLGAPPYVPTNSKDDGN